MDDIDITTPEILAIIHTIKQIQKRMKDPDNSGLNYANCREKLSDEFSTFVQQYPGIFEKVLKCQNLGVTAASLFMKDKVMKGEVNETELANSLGSKFLPNGGNNGSSKKPVKSR